MLLYLPPLLIAPFYVPAGIPWSFAFGKLPYILCKYATAIHFSFYKWLALASIVVACQWEYSSFSSLAAVIFLYFILRCIFSQMLWKYISFSVNLVCKAFPTDKYLPQD